MKFWIFDTYRITRLERFPKLSGVVPDRALLGKDLPKKFVLISFHRLINNGNTHKDVTPPAIHPTPNQLLIQGSPINQLLLLVQDAPEAAL